MKMFEEERTRNEQLANKITLLTEKNEALRDENSQLKFESVRHGSPQVSHIFSQRSTVKCDEGNLQIFNVLFAKLRYLRALSI